VAFDRTIPVVEEAKGSHALARAEALMFHFKQWRKYLTGWIVEIPDIRSQVS
jgi:hypothetical protein